MSVDNDFAFENHQHVEFFILLHLDDFLPFQTGSTEDNLEIFIQSE